MRPLRCGDDWIVYYKLHEAIDDAAKKIFYYQQLNVSQDKDGACYSGCWPSLPGQPTPVARKRMRELEGIYLPAVLPDPPPHIVIRHYAGCSGSIAIGQYAPPGFVWHPGARAGQQGPGVKVWCREHKRERKAGESVVRQFIVASYATVWGRMMGSPDRQMHYYEVIQDGMPCHLYFDLEFDTAVNEQRVADGDNMVDRLIAIVKYCARCDC
jgi:hypothetical protein